jgi:hypothetical protein
MAISVQNLKDITDTFAGMYQVLDAAMGTGIEEGTASLGAANVVALVDALEPEDEIIMLKPAMIVAEKVKSTSIGDLIGSFFRALNIDTDGLDNFLTNNTCRVAPEVKILYEGEMGAPLNYSNVFSPEVDPMATLAIDAQGGETFVHVADIDITKYAPERLTLELTTNWAAGGTVRVTCWQYGGVWVNEDVVIPGSSESGEQFDVGIESSKYYEISAMTLYAGNQINASCKILATREREAIIE